MNQKTLSEREKLKIYKHTFNLGRTAEDGLEFFFWIVQVSLLFAVICAICEKLISVFLKYKIDDTFSANI